MFNVVSARCFLLLVISTLKNCNGNRDSAKLGSDKYFLSGYVSIGFRFDAIQIDYHKHKHPNLLEEEAAKSYGFS
jgi:hypothetical protein